MSVQLANGSPAELELPGRLLELFDYLAARSGEYVPITDLVRVSGLADQGSVRTALHRLLAELDRAGVRSIMENAYGKGYRLNVKSHAIIRDG